GLLHRAHSKSLLGWKSALSRHRSDRGKVPERVCMRKRDRCMQASLGKEEIRVSIDEGLYGQSNRVATAASATAERTANTFRFSRVGFTRLVSRITNMSRSGSIHME